MGEPPGDGFGSDRNTGAKFGEASGLATASVSFAGLDDNVGRLFSAAGETAGKTTTRGLGEAVG